MSLPLRIGTRGSRLALWQANQVATLLLQAGTPSEIVTVKTSGDRLAEIPLADIGGKRLFVKEIEEALRQGRIDLAVHSAKDLPAELADGLTLGAVLPREDPRDAVVCAPYRAPARSATPAALLEPFGDSPRIGTGSSRRVAQLRRLWPGARFESVRGNLDTRLRKLDRGNHDLLILAAAGLRRLGWADRIDLALSIDDCVPAPGQGIIAIEIRSEDPLVSRAVEACHDRPAGDALAAERALVSTLGADCQTPLGAFAEPIGADLDLRAIVMSTDSAQALSARLRGPRGDGVALGQRVGERLLAGGAREILLATHRPSRTESVPVDRGPTGNGRGE